MLCVSPCLPLQHVGDRCFEEGLFEAARTLYAAVGNNGKLGALSYRLILPLYSLTRLVSP